MAALLVRARADHCDPRLLLCPLGRRDFAEVGPHRQAQPRPGARTPGRLQLVRQRRLEEVPLGHFAALDARALRHVPRLRARPGAARELRAAELRAPHAGREGRPPGPVGQLQGRRARLHPDRGLCGVRLRGDDELRRVPPRRGLAEAAEEDLPPARFELPGPLPADARRGGRRGGRAGHPDPGARGCLLPAGQHLHRRHCWAQRSAAYGCLIKHASEGSRAGAEGDESAGKSAPLVRLQLRPVCLSLRRVLPSPVRLGLGLEHGDGRHGCDEPGHDRRSPWEGR
mmetsp:Transcript_9232/g.12246  ORF Transcript_9232/g.12246 Transcript_9232/m.12246 type:complete len:285 (-) Transcript_9232:1111-1965(-)